MRHLLLLILLLSTGFAVGASGGQGVDSLTFPNGELVKGRYVSTEAGFVIFDSLSLGRLHVPVGAATLQLAAALASDRVSSPAAEPATKTSPVAAAAQRPTKTTPQSLSAWKAGFNLSLELRREGSLKSNFYTKAYLTRDFAEDALKVDASYEHNIENDHVTVDVAKFNGYWRHNLNSKYFTIYSPKLEWNRHYELFSFPLHYVLSQQQVGVGRTLLDLSSYHLRAGVAENYFNVWLSLGTAHARIDARVESLFLENEWKLPWDVKLTQRCIYYLELKRGGSGWENDLELVKKLSDHLQIGLSNEFRRDVPAVQSTNYNLWRIFLGLEY